MVKFISDIIGWFRDQRSTELKKMQWYVYSTILCTWLLVVYFLSLLVSLHCVIVHTELLSFLLVSLCCLFLEWLISIYSSCRAWTFTDWAQSAFSTTVAGTQTHLTPKGLKKLWGQTHPFIILITSKVHRHNKGQQDTTTYNKYYLQQRSKMTHRSISGALSHSSSGTGCM